MNYGKRCIYAALALALVGSVAQAQDQSAMVGVVRNVSAASELPQDRLALSGRLRPCYGALCLQFGAVLTRDDFLRISRPFRQFTHFGAGADIGYGRWRIGASVGQFDEHVSEGRRQYYRFVGLLLRYKGPVDVSVEPQLYQFDLSGSTPIHDVRATVRWRFLSADVQRTVGMRQPDARQHWTGTLAIAYKPFMVRLGTQSIPSATMDRNEPHWLTQVGLFWSTR